MLLKVRTIEDIMEKYAPATLKEDYDNVGLMVGDSDATVTKILIALDCTIDVISEAVDSGCNFILTHHPLLFVKPKTITRDTLVGRKIIDLISNGINVYASHTNLDSACGGLNDIATEILGFNKYKIIQPSKNYNCSEGHSGIGRLVCLDEPIMLGKLCENVKKTFKAKAIRYVGHHNDLIKTIAIINGSGEDFFYDSIKLGADCIITGDTKYHGACDLKEEHIALIDAGHFATEWIPLQIFGEKLKKQLIKDGYDNEVIVSQISQDPYKTM
ncbi:Nif3-like dinuclear metal center hexameric protein [Clostridium sp. FP2]|uniref:Nif3-like dinuclear metal center hexameric protein n=1 Tax=Clostridium TaxID=1485 RepID=UPI0013E99AF9|nr:MULTISPECIES: Nif3-like dinuclear metal center hexameric protein [Clostridium]MBW9155020.1 Nif3-like dinuclear metal center hexameric protein [Clostridium tagluense]MBZ9624632.1 Nif3-like dinuclear metal center hexameric protein [Clostridium sp. FP2]WLC64470.1 Nif3-like dinuclear metal center hexameric protein [Clostridium tagluense]